jgi:Na+-driven multidrug efflux pump
MLSPTFLQTTTTGGSVAVIVLTLIGIVLTAVLSLVVAYRVIRGYRRNRSRARLSLALGLVLLTAVPILLGFVLTPTITGVSTVGRTLATTVSRLLGLVAMLYAIYGSTRPRTATPQVKSDSSEVNNE